MRTQFLTAFIVAVITFIALQAFVGHRYWRHGWHRGYYGRYHDPCDDGYYRDNYRGHNQHTEPLPQPDSIR